MQGKLAAIGDQEGVVTIIELCESLCQLQPGEKDNINEMFERETKKEKNLEMARKKAELKNRPKDSTKDKLTDNYDEELQRLTEQFERDTGEQSPDPDVQ